MTLRAAVPARGFTLLEALVALVIFTFGALALYGWQAANLRTLARISDHAEQQRVGYDALAVVQAINPRLEPRGERALGSRRVSWTADPLVPGRIGKTSIGYASLYDLDLYLLDVRVTEGNVELARFQVRQVGYERVRKMTLE